MTRLVICSLILLFSTTTSLAQLRQFVELRDGTRFEGSIEVKEPFLKKAHILLNDTTSILLSDVEKYQSVDGYFVRMHEGMGETFARRIVEGNIDLYTRFLPSGGSSFTPAPFGGGMIYTGVSGSYSSAEYFSKDDGPVLKANARNLKRELADNAESMRYLNRRDGMTAIQIIGILGGIGLTAANINAQLDKENPNFSGTFIGLIMITGSAWIPYYSKKNLTQQAIEVYNQY